MRTCVYDGNSFCPRGYDTCEICPGPAYCDYCPAYTRWLFDKKDKLKGVTFKCEPKKDESLEFARDIVNRFNYHEKNDGRIKALGFEEPALSKLEAILHEYLKLKEANT